MPRPSLASFFGPPMTPERAPLASFFGSGGGRVEEDDPWEDVSPVLQRNRDTGATRPRPIAGAEPGLGKVDTSDPPASLGNKILFGPGATEKGITREKARIADASWGMVVGGLERVGVVPEGTRGELRSARQEAEEEYDLAHPEGGFARAVSETAQAAIAGMYGPQLLLGAGVGGLVTRGAAAAGAGRGLSVLAGAAGGAAEGAGQSYLDVVDLPPEERALQIAMGAGLGFLGGAAAGSKPRPAKPAAAPRPPLAEFFAPVEQAPRPPAAAALAQDEIDRFAKFLAERGLDEEGYYALPPVRQHALDAQFELAESPPLPPASRFPDNPLPAPKQAENGAKPVLFGPEGGFAPGARVAPVARPAPPEALFPPPAALPPEPPAPALSGLSAEQVRRLAEAEERRAGRLRWADSHIDPEEAAKARKGAGMRFAAERREILETPTAKEAEAIARREAGTFVGKPVVVEGQSAVVVGNPFGRVKVRFEDGTERVIPRAALEAPATPGPQLARIGKLAPVLDDAAATPLPTSPSRAGAAAPPDRLPPRSLAGRLTEEPPPTGLLDSTSVSSKEPAAMPILRPAELPPHTSLKNAVAEPERVGRGLRPVEVAARRELGEVFEQARREVDADPGLPRRLAGEVAGKPRSLSDHENSVLLYDRMRLQNEHGQILEAVEAARKAGDEVGELRLQQRLAVLEDARDLNDKAARRAGAEWGRGGRARQMLVAQDYSPMAALQQLRVAAGDRGVPETTRLRVLDLTRKLEEALAATSTAEQQLAKLNDKLTMRRIRRDNAFQARRAGRAASREELAAEFSSLSEQFRKRASTPRAGLDPDLAGIMGKMAANLVKGGVVTLEEVVDQVYQAVRPHLEGLTVREVRDAISGYGKEKKPVDRSVAQQQLDEIHRQGKLVSALEDVEAGQMPPRTGNPLRKPSARVAQLREQVRQVIREQGLDEGARLAALRKRLEAREAELQQQLASGGPPRSRRALPTDADTAARRQRIAALQKQVNAATNDPRRLAVLRKRLARQERELSQRLAEVRGGTLPGKRVAPTPLRLEGPDVESLARVNRLRDLIDGEIRRLKLARRHPAQKGLDWLVKWGRVVKLSSLATTTKLSAAVNARLLSTGAEELVGGITSQLPGLRKVAAKAPRQGGLSVEALAKSYADTFSWETVRDMWRAQKTGKSAFEAAYGELRPAEDHEFLSFVGHMHKALKTPALRHEIRLSLEKRAAHAMRQGLDLADPALQAKINGEALADGYRAILQSDNLFVDEFKAHLGRMRGRGGLARAVASVEEMVLPIVRVPSNFVAEAGSYAGGAARAGWLLRRGVEALTPEEADAVLRNLNKNVLGLALMYVGYRGYEQIGGYHRRGEKRGEDETQAGEIRVGPFRVPHQVLHSAALEMLQVGATIHRIEDRERSRGRDGSMEPYRAAGGGLLKQVPFFEEVGDVTRAGQSMTGIERYGSDFSRGMVLDPNTQRIARILDQEGELTALDWLLQMLGLKHIEARKRYPRNYLEGVELGVPLLREQIPQERMR